ALKLLAKMIGKPAGELEDGFGWGIVADQRRIAFPADFDAGEQISFGTHQPVKPRRLEVGVLAENLGIGREGDAGAPPVGRCAQLFERRYDFAAREALAIELPIAGDL